MANLMKAFGITKFGGVENLQLVQVPKHTPGERDLLVRIKAIAVNPVDTKKRKGGTTELKDPLILGWDAAGIVEEVGAKVSLFKVGDEVYYAGSVRRPGCNAEFGVVDERLVGRKPKSLSFEESAAIPLTAITGWEAMVEQLGIPLPDSDRLKERNAKKSILIVAGAGGTGSIGIQIAKRVLGVGRVIATASRPDTIAYSKKMGADDVIDHKKDIKQELANIGLSSVDYIYNCSTIEDKYDALSSVLSPLGKIVCIVETNQPLNVGNLMGRRGTFTWELMFTRSIYGIDQEYQGEILNTVSELLDNKVLVTTVTKVYENMSHLQEAHKQQESGSTIGKLVLKAVF